MENHDGISKWIIQTGVFGLVALLWALNYFLEKANFFYWIGEIFDKKRVTALEDFAASRGARYSYKPKENYFQTLRDFPLIAIDRGKSYQRIVNELKGSTGIYRYTFFDLASSNTVLLLESENLTLLPDFSLLKRYFLCELNINFRDTLVKIPNNEQFTKKYYISTEEKQVEELFTPGICQHFVEIKEGFNIEKLDSKALLYCNRTIPVDEMRDFLNQSSKTMDLLLAQEAQLPKADDYKISSSSNIKINTVTMEILYQCFDEEEHAYQLDLLKINGIPYTTKTYINDQGNDVFEIWVTKEQLTKADSLIEEEEAKAVEDEKLKNPPCPKCYKYAAILNVDEVKGGSLQIYRCDNCGYEWPKK